MGSLRLGELASINLILGITTGDADVRLDELNDQISFEVEQFVFGSNLGGFRTTGGPVPPDEVEYHDGGIDAVILRRLLSDQDDDRDAVVVLENGITLTQGTDYHIDTFPSVTVRRLAGVADDFKAVFASGSRNVKVTYKLSPNPPGDIARVVEQEVARAYLMALNDSTEGGFLVISQRSPDAGDSVTYRDTGFTEHTMEVLRRWRDEGRYF